MNHQAEVSMEMIFNVIKILAVLLVLLAIIALISGRLFSFDVFGG